jgi:hypothetical protein
MESNEGELLRLLHERDQLLALGVPSVWELGPRNEIVGFQLQLAEAVAPDVAPDSTP